jgi:excisionase family DNA binding protein
MAINEHAMGGNAEPDELAAHRGTEAETDTVRGHLLKARVVAELLDVSCETVLRWTRRGELPAVRLPGGQIRFPADALHAWITERRTGPARREEAA